MYLTKKFAPKNSGPSLCCRKKVYPYFELDTPLVLKKRFTKFFKTCVFSLLKIFLRCSDIPITCDTNIKIIIITVRHNLSRVCAR